MNIQNPEQVRARMDAVFGPPPIARLPSARDAFIASIAGGAIRGIAEAALQPVAQNRLNGDRVAVVQARHHHRHPAAAAAQNGQVPDGVAIGGVEVLGGALLLILGTIFHPAAAVGIGMILDGGVRAFNAMEQNPVLPNGQNQNPMPPPPQGGVNF